MEVSKKAVPLMRKRVEWVDVAKGVAIILVIIGHVVKFGTVARHIIFSFHMPLFFILSGFTSKRITTSRELQRKTIKDIKFLILPILLVKAIQIFFSFINVSDQNFISLMRVIVDTGKQFVYCSGVSVHDMPALGMTWFLVSLFTARLIINMVHVSFKKDDHEIILISLGILGVILSLRGYRLPFNIDATLVAIFFITVGVLAKKYFITIKKYTPALIVPSAMMWLSSVMSGYYIDISARRFGTPEPEAGLVFIPILAALAGSFLFCLLCRTLMPWQSFKNTFLLLGANSMVVYLVHAVDSSMKVLWGRYDSVAITCLLRVVCCVAIAVSIIWIKQEIRHFKEARL